MKRLPLPFACGALLFGGPPRLFAGNVTFGTISMVSMEICHLHLDRLPLGLFPDKKL
jgi:hypothetical protein